MHAPDVPLVSLVIRRPPNRESVAITRLGLLWCRRDSHLILPRLVLKYQYPSSSLLSLYFGNPVRNELFSLILVKLVEGVTTFL